jgi:hypothetical protein
MEMGLSTCFGFASSPGMKKGQEAVAEYGK